MEFPAPLLIAVTTLVAAGLLWLAAEVGVAAAAQPPLQACLLLGVALGLAGCGLWWPMHAMPPVSSLFGASPLACLPVFVLAALAIGVGRLFQRRAMLWALAAATVMPMVAYVHLMLFASGALRAAQAAGPAGLGAAALLPCVALVGMQLQLANRRLARSARAVAALAAGLFAGLCAALSSAAGAVPAPLADGSGWLLAVVLIGIAAALLAVVARAAPAAGAPRPLAGARDDGLTGLPTRLHFERQLAAAMKRGEGRAPSLAVFFIDLDGFKPVNDSFGHSSGDRVLEQVGQRLKLIARANCLVARIGGDEFVMMARGVASQEAAAPLAQRVIEALSKPYDVDQRQVTIACSVGIAMPLERDSAAKLIARADAAMYAAKRAGGSRHAFHSPSMDADVQQNFDLLAELRHALAHDELELFFQPKIDARSGQVTAAEALLRWHHPRRGMVMPDQFIPLAERSGLIGPVGDWVIEAACKQARAWRDKGLRMRVAINLSAHQMRQPDIAERIAEALSRHRVHPSLLTCEITESAAMEDTSATQETFRCLGELGAHVSIDDFGTGYSSLAYLRRLPAEELKIDRSFVQDLDHSSDARAVVDAVMRLAHALGLKVVAEGVETPRQQEILIELGCDEMQGFLFAKPMTARALLLWAIEDRAQSAFRGSLFLETRQAMAPAQPLRIGVPRTERQSEPQSAV
jgi:diguanylate cyclase (GGDEF)-like protein